MLSLIALFSFLAIVPYSSLAIAIQHGGNHPLSQDYEAPIQTSSNGKHIDDQYIVVFHKDTPSHAIAAHHTFLATTLLAEIPSGFGGVEQATFAMRSPFKDLWGAVKHTYNITNSLFGYSGKFSKDAVELLRKDPNVAFVEKDQIVHTLEQEKNAPWGLARLSHRESLSFATFNKYDYDKRAGEGVTAYIIDTGIHVDHVEFEGRAVWGATFSEGEQDIDGNGHGTHCAGTIASKTYGVAKKAKVVAVKVLGSNGSGAMSDVLKGVEWAAEAAQKEAQDAKEKGSKSKYKGSTANMSLGGGKSVSLDEAINAAVAAGLHFAVAAGNDNADACNYSPAASEGAVTVGCSGLTDGRCYFSNHGKCVDIFAPGLNILSTWIGSKSAVNTISGTSMSSPHVCGLLTYFLSLAPEPNSEFAAPLSPAKLKKRLLQIGTTGVLTDLPPQTVNLLAWNGGVSKNGTSDFWEKSGFDNGTSIFRDVETRLAKEIEKLERESHEWMKHAKEWVRKEVEGAY